MERKNKTYEDLTKMCLSERLHIRFTTWESLNRAVQKAMKDYSDKEIHGEIVIELR